MARHDYKEVKSVYDPMAKNNIVPIEQSELSSKEIERLRKLPKRARLKTMNQNQILQRVTMDDIIGWETALCFQQGVALDTTLSPPSGFKDSFRGLRRIMLGNLAFSLSKNVSLGAAVFYVHR